MKCSGLISQMNADGVDVQRECDGVPEFRVEYSSELGKPWKPWIEVCRQCLPRACNIRESYQDKTCLVTPLAPIILPAAKG